LYGCATWFLGIRETQGLRVFEKRVLRRIFGPKWKKVAGDFLGKLTVTQLSGNFLPFMKPEGSLPRSQEPATGPYPEPDASTPHLPTALS
jgi:hypothetical protein